MAPARGAVISNVTIGFEEYPFPTTTTTITNGGGSTLAASTSYNLINDTTGAELTSDNGDLSDFTINFTSSAAPQFSANNRPRIRFDENNGSERFESQKGFTTPTANNPGDRQINTITLRFEPHIKVTNFIGDFTSLNSDTIAWEYSLIGFLRPDGTLFSSQPTINPYLNHTSFNNAGITSPSQGWTVMDSKLTTVNVGSNDVSAGTDGSNDDFILTYASAGLAPGTEIGGIVWINVAENTLGTSDNNSNPPSYWNSFEFSGETVPEPLTILGSGVALGFGAFLKKRQKGIAAKKSEA
jgi:hypothetical protein